MNLITGGSFRWPDPPTANVRDWRVLEALRHDWRRIDVIVKAGSPGPTTFESEGICVHYVDRWPGATPGFVAAACRAALRINRTHPAALFAASDPIVAWAGYRLRRRTSVPVLLHLQGEILAPPAGYGSRLKRAALGAASRSACRRADAVRALYPTQIEALQAIGVSRQRITLVRNRCDTSLFDRTRWTEAGRKLRASLDIADRPVLLCVGSLVALKGVHLAIDSLARVQLQHPGAVLVIVGDGPARADLENQARASGLADDVIFCGRVSNDAIPQYLAAGDVFLSPSLTEASPRTVIEAAAMQCAIVATAVGGVPDIVADGSAGLLVRADDADGLGQAAGRLLGDDGLRQSMGSAAREAVAERFEYQRNLEALRALYRQVAETRSDEGGNTRGAS